MENNKADRKFWLDQKYTIEKLTMKQIAILCGCSHSTIHQRLKKYNIPTRSRYECFKKELHPMWGRKHSKETKEKMSLAKKRLPKEFWLGKNNHFYGKRHSKAQCEKWSHDRSGDKNVNWRGGKIPINTRLRSHVKFFDWRKAVFERDNYICVRCGYDEGHILNAHHIIPVHTSPEEIFEITNGATVCIPCHRHIHKYELGKTQ